MLKIIKELSIKWLAINGIDEKIRGIRIKTLLEKKVSDYPDIQTLIAGYKTTIEASSIADEQKSALKARLVITMTLEALTIMLNTVPYAPITTLLKTKNLIEN